MPLSPDDPALIEQARLARIAVLGGRAPDPDPLLAPLQLARRLPPTRGRMLDLSGATVTPEAETLRAEALGLVALGAVGLAAGRGESADPRALLGAAFGGERSSRLLRHRIAGGDGPVPDLPGGIPLIDPRLLLAGELLGLLDQLRLAGASFAAAREAEARAGCDATGITSVHPLRACPGDVVVLHGSGFGADPPAGTAVLFPNGRGGALSAPIAKAPPDVGSVPAPDQQLQGGRITPTITPGSLTLADGWTDTAIAVVVPEGAGAGCVGFLRRDPGAAGGTMAGAPDLEAAAGMVQSTLADLYGPQGAAAGQVIVDAVGAIAREPVSKKPPCLPPGADGRVPNRFEGVPVPQVTAFTAAGPGGSPAASVAVESGRPVTLSWAVDGATSVRITADDGSALPRLHGALPPHGEITLTPRCEGQDEVTGSYTLTATGRCARATAAVRVTVREREPLWGLADTHAHLVGQYAHGGMGVWGRMYPETGPITGEGALAAALPPCNLPGGHGTVWPSITWDGVSGGHSHFGHPEFVHWPGHLSFAHQQVFLDWLRRAVDGGLRLAVCLASNSEAWADQRAVPPGLRRPHNAADDALTRAAGGYPTDDAGSIRLQLAAMRDLVARVNAATGGNGWVQIAQNPEHARQIIAAGRLALVPGVEVQSLGGWHSAADLDAAALAAGSTPRALIADLLDDLVGLGVRHLFPVHGIDNAFAGGGLFNRMYSQVSKLIHGRALQASGAPEDAGVSYRLEQHLFPQGFFGELISDGFPEPAWERTPGGHMNPLGLTAHGRILLEEMAVRGMVIDVDHMGMRGFDQALTVCEGLGYPVVSGHAQFRELKAGWRDQLPSRARALGLPISDDQARTADFRRDDRSSQLLFGTADASRLSTEIDKTGADLSRICALGGLVSPILIQPEPLRHDVPGVAGVEATSSGSARALAQAILYAWERMGGRGVALGSDINGAAELPGPRFGPIASDALRENQHWLGRLLERDVSGFPARWDRRQEAFAQERGVRYSSALRDPRRTRFSAGDPTGTGLISGTGAYHFVRPFTGTEFDVWLALCARAAGLPPEPGRVRDLHTGLTADPVRGAPAATASLATRAAFLAVNPSMVTGAEPAELTQLVATVRLIADHFATAELSENRLPDDLATRLGPSGSGLYDAGRRLHRSTGGTRDWDLNLDGMAHYGLLPDLLQDLWNVGLDERVMRTLYRSAEDYVQVWERCEARSLTAAVPRIRATAPGLALVRDRREGQLLVVADPLNGVRLLRRAPGGRWREPDQLPPVVQVPGRASVDGGGPWPAAVAVTSTDGRGWVRMPGPLGWLSPTGAIGVDGPPALFVGEAGAELFAVDPSGAVVTSRLTAQSGVSPWSPVPGLSPGAGTVLTCLPDRGAAPGKAALACVDPSGRLLLAERTGQDRPWNSWTVAGAGFDPAVAPLGGAGGGSAFLVVWSQGRPLLLDLVLSAGAAHRTEDLGLRLAGRPHPALVGRSLFVVDSDGRLLARELSPTGTQPWFELHSGLAPNAAVAAVQVPDEGILLAVPDPMGVIWTATWLRDTDCTPWQPLP